jgi:UDP-N-acetylglucosamine---dolichyl-phosphate N-acetylglucosaminyltransferase
MPDIDTSSSVLRVAALIPVYHGDALETVARGALSYVERVLVVDDGAPASVAARAATLASVDPRIDLLVLGPNRGKGFALAAGFEALLSGPSAPDAVLTLDADGQHPTDRIPAFLSALASADVVIGRRRERRRGGMPLVRRVANFASSRALSLAARQRMPDAQNGMRLLRADVVRSTPLVGGRFEAETRHLKALARAGAAIEWVDIPTIYGGEPSSFHAVADSARIAREVVR